MLLEISGGPLLLDIARGLLLLEMMGGIASWGTLLLQIGGEPSSVRSLENGDSPLLENAGRPSSLTSLGGLHL